MTIIDKIALLNLGEKEEKKAKEKFMAALSLISEEELRERLGFLEGKDVRITKAKDIKVLVIPTEELAKKFSILDEIHETDLYVSVPSALLLNVIDVYKKLKYCIQNGIKYKDGLDYDKDFIDSLRNEEKWKEFLGKREKENATVGPLLDGEDASLSYEPNSGDDARETDNALGNKTEIKKAEHWLPFNDGVGIHDPNVNEDYKIPEDEEPKVPEDNVISFGDLNNAEQDLDAKTTSFEDLKKELERKMQELDGSLNPDGSMYSPDYDISFSDIEPEQYGMGGR